VDEAGGIVLFLEHADTSIVNISAGTMMIGLIIEFTHYLLDKQSPAFSRALY